MQNRHNAVSLIRAESTACAAQDVSHGELLFFKCPKLQEGEAVIQSSCPRGQENKKEGMRGT